MAPSYARLACIVSEKALQAMDAQHNMFISKRDEQLEYAEHDRPALVKKVGLWSMKRKQSRQIKATIASAIKQLNQQIAQDVKTTRGFAKLSLQKISSGHDPAAVENTFRIIDAQMMSEVKRNITKHLSTGDVTNHAQSESNGVKLYRTERIQNTETPYVNSGRWFKSTLAKASDDPHAFLQVKSVKEKT